MALTCQHLRRDREVAHTWSDKVKHLFLDAMARESCGGRRLVRCLETPEGYCFRSTHYFPGVVIKIGDRFLAWVID